MLLKTNANSYQFLIYAPGMSIQLFRSAGQLSQMKDLHFKQSDPILNKYVTVS